MTQTVIVSVLFSSAYGEFAMKAVIYAHYSSDNQREESIEGQLRECNEFAERNGITVLGTYIDPVRIAIKTV